MTFLENFIDDYPNFPKTGILFKDILPILQNPSVFSKLIKDMAKWDVYKQCDAIIAIDARGFIFGSAIAFHLSKPLILARKSGKLPGEILEQTYQLEYGNDSLAIQKKALNRFEKFIIVDDLLAKGGTVSCVVDIVSSINKRILGLSVVVELKELNGKEKFNFPVDSQLLI